MPLPFLIWGAVAVAAAVGVGSAISGKNDLDSARSIAEYAKERYDYKKHECEKAIRDLNLRLEELGKAKIIAASHIEIFIKSIKRIGAIDGKYDTLFESIGGSVKEFKQMETMALKSAEIVSVGFGALGAGVAAGMGATGLATTIGVASTGTAISSLAGVAATNATLAWLGGGSLAAGGFGMTGGMMALGGIFAAPVALIGGLALASKGEEALSDSYRYEARVDKAIAEIDVQLGLINEANNITNDYIRIIGEIDKNAVKSYKELESLVEYYAANDIKKVEKWTSGHQNKLLIAKNFAIRIKELCTVSVIDNNNIAVDGKRVLIEAKQFLLENRIV